MPLKDLLQNKLEAADLQNINKAIDAIEAAIKGKMASLTPEERQKFGSINEQNKLVVNKVNDYRVSHPQFNTTKVDWVEFEKDFIARRDLELVQNRLVTLLAQVGDTKTLHDYDNYQQSLSQYSYLSYLYDQDEPGVTAVKDDIAQFFPGRGAAVKPADA